MFDGGIGMLRVFKSGFNEPDAVAVIGEIACSSSFYYEELV